MEGSYKKKVAADNLYSFERALDHKKNPYRLDDLSLEELKEIAIKHNSIHVLPLIIQKKMELIAKINLAISADETIKLKYDEAVKFLLEICRKSRLNGKNAICYTTFKSLRDVDSWAAEEFLSSISENEDTLLKNTIIQITTSGTEVDYNMIFLLLKSELDSDEKSEALFRSIASSESHGRTFTARLEIRGFDFSSAESLFDQLKRRVRIEAPSLPQKFDFEVNFGILKRTGDGAAVIRPQDTDFDEEETLKRSRRYFACKDLFRDALNGKFENQDLLKWFINLKHISIKKIRRDKLFYSRMPELAPDPLELHREALLSLLINFAKKDQEYIETNYDFANLIIAALDEKDIDTLLALYFQRDSKNFIY